mmetsp:Transcript_8202/g.27248  ORF Transcript_8202/g.27248 Transcript_8202/m.27248 type:complete len:115 (-) Transcript_8202:191-535(-)
MKGLEELYRKHPRFNVLGFPSNDFNQEPMPNHELKTWQMEQMGSTFPLFALCSVNGDAESPVFTFVKSANPDLAGDVTWNFNRFLIDKHGYPVKRYGPAFNKAELERDILELLS